MSHEGPVIKCLLSNMSTFLRYSCLPTVTPGFNKPMQIVNLTLIICLSVGPKGFPFMLNKSLRRKERTS